MTEDIEAENLYDEEHGPEITEPFNPKDVDIVAQPMVISNIIDDLKHDDIILDPDFQRNPNLWDDRKQSRLIESLVIRIPLPSFYFDSDEEDHYEVVDGLQRLWSIKRFAVLEPGDPQKLRLSQLEYLHEYDGKTFEELPQTIQRRIKTQQVTAYVIRPGTPDNVRTSLFTRINTGGMVLTPAEIRNSVYRGTPARLLKELAETEEFCRATRNTIKPDRMLDREFVNRFLAFYLFGEEKYKGSLDEFMNDALAFLKDASQEKLNDYKHDFRSTMTLAYDIFGERAFRKLQKNGQYGPINKPLFEVVGSQFGRLNDAEREKLLNNSASFQQDYIALIQDSEFLEAITMGTGRIASVRLRHNKFREIVRKAIEV